MGSLGSYWCCRVYSVSHATLCSCACTYSTRSCYETTLISESAERVHLDDKVFVINDSPVCTLSPIFTGQVIPTIQVAGNQSVSGIFSPQFFSENETYPANTLCRYNVQCPPDRLLYFQVIRQQLEGESNGKCLDSLDIERPSLDSRSTTCGSEVEGFADLESGRLDVQFLTNSRAEDRGFFVFAVCFDPENQDQPGCVNPSGDRGDVSMYRLADRCCVGSQRREGASKHVSWAQFANQEPRK